MRLKGNFRIEFRHHLTGETTKPDFEQSNLIFQQTYWDILGSQPQDIFRTANIYISSQQTAPQYTDTGSTGILATGFVPSGTTSPVWYESVTPNFGEIQNQINAPSADRTFYTVGLTGLTATLLSIPCTQSAYEILTIYYRIEVLNTRGQRLSSRFVRDFGGSIFGVKNCYHDILGCSYADAPTAIYIDPYQPGNLTSDGALDSRHWNTSAVIQSHYKFKETITLGIALSIPPGADENIGMIFNAMLSGLSNSIQPSSKFIAGNNSEGVNAAYRISSYSQNVVNIDPTLPVFAPPFQKIWSHKSGAPSPFFDPLNVAIGQGYPSIAGSWTGSWPELYKYTVSTSGDVGAATYKFSKKLHLGFNGNSYSDAEVICPFRNPNTPSATGIHGWKPQDNDFLWYSSTQIVQYDDTGITLLDLMNGNYQNWDTTTTPPLPVTTLRQCAVDTANKLIYAACRFTGLYVINPSANTITQISPTPCYGVDVGGDSAVFAIFQGSLQSSIAWGTPLAFVYAGLTDSNWSRAFYLKVDPSTNNIGIVIDSPSNPGNSRRIVWYQQDTNISLTGFDSAIGQWSAAFDVSDVGSFWAATPNNKLIFGANNAIALNNAIPCAGINHNVWGQITLGKVAFYQQYLITVAGITDQTNNIQSSFGFNGYMVAVIHLEGGISLMSDVLNRNQRLRQLFTDNNYCWENYGWNGTSWDTTDTTAKPTHSSAENLIQGLTIAWNDSSISPSLNSGDFYTQGILNGVWKDNATTIYFENFWYDKAVHFDSTVGTGLTVPTSAPYQLTVPDKSNPVFLTIEVDSVNQLSNFMLNNNPVATIYVNGETPGPGEISINGSTGVITFNSANAGEIFTGTYAWIEE